MDHTSTVGLAGGAAYLLCGVAYASLTATMPSDWLKMMANSPLKSSMRTAPQVARVVALAWVLYLVVWPLFAVLDLYGAITLGLCKARIWWLRLRLRQMKNKKMR
ncbi:hypothetical protein ABZS76_32725 [Streptomyces sp. NPDC005562]|uniref:hypothetical protein n=1 Tax=Streptomyces sp. NPDC005562 TaxID=3154890 RepID=UPI0033A074E7